MSSSNPQNWDPARYDRNARFVSDLALPVVELLSPQSGERILDLGCGDGALTIRLAALGCAVIGVDSSVEMVRAARLSGVDARVMDGQSLQFASEFDAVFSNAALHWMQNPESVISGVWHALKPGGRFVGEFGGYGNVAAIITALESALSSRGKAVANPWFFPRPKEYQELLEASGFEIRVMDLIPRPTLLPGDVGGWLETFAQPYTSALPATDRPRLVSEVVEALRPSNTINVRPGRHASPRLLNANGTGKVVDRRRRIAATGFSGVCTDRMVVPESPLPANFIFPGHP